MGKRSDYERITGDRYDTPLDAVVPLVPHLDGAQRYIEPCAGHGYLVAHLVTLSRLDCVYANDITNGFDAHKLTQADVKRWGADVIITNPPWTRAELHPLIEHFASLLPSWLLFDADWAYTKQAALLLTMCSHIVAVGRVRWIRDSPHQGKDNCSWYRFHAPYRGPTKFIGRQP